MTESHRFHRLQETPSQTAGPFLHIGLAPAAAGLPEGSQAQDNVIAGAAADGERIRIEGYVLDGAGHKVKDAALEVWQADARGAYPGGPLGAAPFRGWGRAVTDFSTGLYWFETVKPGPVAGRAGPDGKARPSAPHLTLWIVARGINIGLTTRLYFDDEAEANARDAVLGLVEHAGRRDTLIARRESRGGETVYRFDIVLQGEGETVFFDV
ncbi:MAG: protocatechuate 3,4-dioxygenase subunit alpha [Tistlia sp.]|uniref:protocatechuate 3,4-dioxygenase subunit alpha n=1 Tax=Tistlia sp. TaxID=3057121 RepID=UPI0034A50C37